jgi:hypothetical protein
MALAIFTDQYNSNDANIHEHGCHVNDSDSRSEVRALSATEVKLKWRAEKISESQKIASIIDSSWRQKQIASWCGTMHKKCFGLFIDTWQIRNVELRAERVECDSSVVVYYKPVLHYYAQKADKVVEKSMVVQSISREANVTLESNGRRRACLSLKVGGRKHPLVLAAEQPRDALALAFLVRFMLEPGRFSREEYLDSDTAIAFPDRTLWSLMSQ